MEFPVRRPKLVYLGNYASARRRLLAGVLAVALLASLSATGGAGAASPDDPPIPTAPPLLNEVLAESLDHPFLIVRKSEYAALRARADRYPWSGMKKQARQDCADLSYSSRATIARRACGSATSWAPAP